MQQKWDCLLQNLKQPVIWSLPNVVYLCNVIAIYGASEVLGTAERWDHPFECRCKAVNQVQQDIENLVYFSFRNPRRKHRNANFGFLECHLGQNSHGALIQYSVLLNCWSGNIASTSGQIEPKCNNVQSDVFIHQTYHITYVHGATYFVRLSIMHTYATESTVWIQQSNIMRPMCFWQKAWNNR